MIVGLLGFIGSGKGTAGDILKDMGFTPVSFAKGVKDAAAEMFGWPRSLLEGDTNISRDWREKVDPFWSKQLGKNITPRLVLQLMGTEVGRNVFHKDFWVIRLQKHIEDNPGQNWVITDVRFANEMNFVHKQGGTLIEIQRGELPNWYEIASRANKGKKDSEEFMLTKSGIHESEWRWIGGDIDHVIQNDGTLDDLKMNVIKALTKSYGSSKIVNNLHNGVLNETI
jgi:PAS domain-containing protein